MVLDILVRSFSLTERRWRPLRFKGRNMASNGDLATEHVNTGTKSLHNSGQVPQPPHSVLHHTWSTSATRPPLYRLCYSAASHFARGTSELSFLLVGAVCPPTMPQLTRSTNVWGRLEVCCVSRHGWGAGAMLKSRLPFNVPVDSTGRERGGEGRGEEGRGGISSQWMFEILVGILL